jgi:AraC family transcriptional regulator
MQAHLTEDIRLAELAKIAKLSYRYLLRSRIQRAEQLLATTRFPIADIPTQVGFADQSHFTKALRRFVGATPKRWREDRQGRV